MGGYMENMPEKNELDLSELLGKKVIVSYQENSLTQTVTGLFTRWQGSFIFIKGDFAPFVISIKNITEIQLLKENSQNELLWGTRE